MGFIAKVKEFLGSKKWYMTILGSVLVMVGHHYGMPEMVLQLVAGLFGTYVVGQGISDISN